MMGGQNCCELYAMFSYSLHNLLKEQKCATEIVLKCKVDLETIIH